MLPLPPCPTLSSATGPLQNNQSAVIPGVRVNGNAPLKLGLFNIKEQTLPRTANIILWPGHPFWQIRTTREFYAYLEASFPQLDRLREAVPEAVAQAFLDAPLAQFRAPQTCRRLVSEQRTAREPAAVAGDRVAELQGSAVCILGDAAHVFPPGASLAACHCRGGVLLLRVPVGSTDAGLDAFPSSVGADSPCLGGVRAAFGQAVSEL